MTRLAWWLAHRWLARSLPPDRIDDILDDLQEDFDLERRSRSSISASLWLLGEARSLGAAYRRTQRENASRGGRPSPSAIVRDLGRDLRFGVRLLYRQPGSSAVIVLTLAIGIGANTAMFSVVETVFLRPLPVTDPARLVLFNADPLTGTRSGDPPEGVWDLFSSASYDFFQRAGLPIGSIAAMAAPDTVAGRWLAGTRGSPASTTPTRAQLVSGNYFETMGVTAEAGRLFSAADDRPDASPVAVISDRFWRRSLAAIPAAVGSPLTLNDVTVTIVGIAPAAFFGERVTTAPDCWVPLAWQPRLQRRESMGIRQDYYWLTLIGRLRDRESRAGAERAVTNALHRFLTDQAGSRPDAATTTRIAGSHVVMADGARGILPARQTNATPLALLSAAVGLMLLIACANVATLLVCRAAGRSTEIAVRRALGASRLRLIRLGLSEAMVLATLGAAVGVLLATAFAPALLAFFPAGPIQPKLDLPVLAFAVAVTLASCTFFGLAPAMQAGSTSALAALRTTGHGSGDRRRLFGAAEPFVVVQIAFSLVLCLGATLFGRTLFNLEHEPLGFDQDAILLARIDPRSAGYTPATVGAFYRLLYEHVAALPGIDNATFARYSPFSGSRSTIGATVDGYTPARGEKVNLETVPVGPNYPATIGMPLVSGRAIALTDDRGAPVVAMVNEAFARRFFAGSSPLGHAFHMSSTSYEIVGVVRDALFHSARDQSAPVVFTSMLQEVNQRILDCEIEIRARGDASALATVVRRAVADTDGRVPVLRTTTMRTQVLSTLGPERRSAGFVGSFAIVALLVAAVGLYGVVAHGVARRTKELGIRLALGASPQTVVWLAVRSTFACIAIGIALGAAAAAFTVRLVETQLFGISPADPISFVVSIGVLCVIATGATLVPTLRAIHVDPIAALRAD